MDIVTYFKYAAPTLIFFFILESFMNNLESFESNLNLLLYYYLALLIMSSLSAFWITRYRPLSVAAVWIFATGSILFNLSLSKSGLQHFFIIILSLVFMVLLIGLDRFFAQEGIEQTQDIKPKILDSGFNLNQSIILASVFLLSTGIYGIYVDLDLPTWEMMSAIFAGIFFATLYLTKINFLKSKALQLHLDTMKNKTFLLYSFLSGFLILQLIWAVTFLPISHFTSGAVVLSYYYSIWNIIRSHLRNELTHNIIITNAAFFVLAASIILATSKWGIA